MAEIRKSIKNRNVDKLNKSLISQTINRPNLINKRDKNIILAK